jgi:SAM-dependent methyltransferase
MELAEVQRRFPDYGFYHTIELAPGVRTPGWPTIVPLVEMTLRSLCSLDLRGKRVLDVGCRDGLFAFAAERLGAREVVAIDNDLSRGAVELLIPFFRSRVRMRELNLLELRPETFGTFDVVIFPGVLYHLRYPFWALKILRDLLPEGGHLVLETALLIDDNRRAVLHCPVGADSPYEPTCCTFFNRKGLTDTLGSLGLVPLTFEYLSNAPRAAGPVGLEPVCTAPAPDPDGDAVVDRATLVCRRRTGAADARVTGYWEGTHRYSSSVTGTWWRSDNHPAGADRRRRSSFGSVSEPTPFGDQGP